MEYWQPKTVDRQLKTNDFLVNISICRRIKIFRERFEPLDSSRRFVEQNSVHDYETANTGIAAGNTFSWLLLRGILLPIHDTRFSPAIIKTAHRRVLCSPAATPLFVPACKLAVLLSFRLFLTRNWARARPSARRTNAVWPPLNNLQCIYSIENRRNTYLVPTCGWLR